jgi:hypothetical protein
MIIALMWFFQVGSAGNHALDYLKDFENIFLGSEYT